MSQTPQPPRASHEDEEEYYAVAAIPYVEGDYREHNDSGFCDNMTHECHENQESITDLNNAIQGGLATTDDADRIFRGKTVLFGQTSESVRCIEPMIQRIPGEVTL